MAEIKVPTTTTKRVGIAAALATAAVTVAACGSSSSGGPAVTSGGQPTSSTGSSGSADTAGTSFSVAHVSGLGNVVVDGRGRTVYVLTKPGMKNVPCTDGSGCTDIWPDLSLPDGTSSANAGHGVTASMLGTKPANGETYPTYNGWLLYEYSGDSAAGQGHGEGITSFGGTWYALNAAGNLVKPNSASSSGGAPSSSPTSGGYGY